VLLRRTDAVLHRAKPILERGETMFECGQAIKAMPKVAHLGGQRQNARAEPTGLGTIGSSLAQRGVQTDFLLTDPSLPPDVIIRCVRLVRPTSIPFYDLMS
jgi:hypothetical protein